MSRKHQDTKITLYPLPFGEAIETLAQAPKHEDSQYAKLKERLLDHASGFASQLVEATVCLPQAR